MHAIVAAPEGLGNPIDDQPGNFPKGKELLFVHATEAELVAYPRYLAVGKLHLDELGTGEGLTIGAFQGGDPFLGLGVEIRRVLALSG